MTNEQAYKRLQSQTDEQLKALLKLAGLSDFSFSRQRAIDLLTGNCSGCNGNLTVTYTNGNGNVNAPCKTCN
jgi:hypothetical protein